MNIKAKEILKNIYGYDNFREGQYEIISNLIDKKDVLCIMPTGGGKSICFQIPAIISKGITIVISPLISLMVDQVLTLKTYGIPAAYINSSLTPKQIDLVIKYAKELKYKIIYIAPERLSTQSFVDLSNSINIDYLIVDEAHCISQWGHEFRPSYLQIKEYIKNLKNKPTLGAFTATATNIVRDDIVKLLELRNPEIILTGFDRKNLYYEVIECTDNEKDSVLLNALIEFQNNSGIIYCSTRKKVDEIYNMLGNCNYKVSKYHAGLNDEIKQINQNDFINDKTNIMVATNAFGMGIDKSNVRFVIHYNMPSDIESYYQESGRAGRDGSPSKCILLYSKKDEIIAQYFIDKYKEESNFEDEILKKQIYKKENNLRSIIKYCKSKRCLRNVLLEYFDENPKGTCKNCSICNRLSKYNLISNLSIFKNENIDLSLRNKLNVLRKNIAIRTGVPPYIIFSDKILDSLSSSKPTTFSELKKIPGIGDHKSMLYGYEILSEIKNHIVEYR